MPESKTTTSGNGQRRRSSSPPEPGVALQHAVADRPWLMLGAATGAGLTLGLQSRRLAESRAVGMFFATLSGIAIRVATNALVEWLQSRQRQA